MTSSQEGSSVKSMVETLDVGVANSAIEQRILRVFESMDNPELKKQALDVFYKLSSLNTEIQSAVQKIDLLNGLKEEDIQKETLVNTLQSLYRKKNRIIRMQVLQVKGTEKQKQISQNKDIETFSAKDMLSAEQEKKGFLAQTFAYKINKDS